MEGLKELLLLGGTNADVSPLCQAEKTKWEPLNVVSKLEADKDTKPGNQWDSLLQHSFKNKRLVTVAKKSLKARFEMVAYFFKKKKERNRYCH